MPAQYDGFLEAIGNTPLIRLNGASDATGCEIYGKAEFMNPGGSVKDRAAKGIIEDAEATGKLKKRRGKALRGILASALLCVCQCSGYKCVIVMARNPKPRKARSVAVIGGGFAPRPCRALQRPQ